MTRQQTTTNELLGQRIRALRATAGLTQQELGAQADVNYKYIGEIERGKQNPSLATLDKIASALGVKLSVMLDFGPEVLGRKEIRTRIRGILDEIPTSDLVKILQILTIYYPPRKT